MGEDVGILERIAITLEGINSKIGAALEAIVSDSEGLELAKPYILTPEQIEEMKVSVAIPPTQGHIVITPKEELDPRPALLVQCKELGINVPKGTRTNTLQRWVKEAKTENAVSGQVVDTEIILPYDREIIPPYDREIIAPPIGPPIDPPKAYTRDEVRVALINLCKKNNNDTTVCKAILENYKAKDVSALDESRFADFMSDIRANGGEI